MTVSAGRRRWPVTLNRLGTPVATGAGAYTQALEALDPATAYAEVTPATARAVERLFSGTVVGTATLLVTIPYHPGVTLATVIGHRGRTLSVVGFVSPDEREIETVCACVEVVP